MDCCPYKGTCISLIRLLMFSLTAAKPTAHGMQSQDCMFYAFPQLAPFTTVFMVPFPLDRPWMIDNLLQSTLHPSTP